MTEKYFFFSFIFMGVPYVFFITYVKLVLKKNNYKITLLDFDFSNYRNIKKLSKDEKKYRWLYLGLLISTSLLILVFLMFILYLFFYRK